MAQRTKMFKQKLPSGQFKDVNIGMEATYVYMNSGLTAQQMIGNLSGKDGSIQSQLDAILGDTLDFVEIDTW